MKFAWSQILKAEIGRKIALISCISALYVIHLVAVLRRGVKPVALQ